MFKNKYEKRMTIISLCLFLVFIFYYFLMTRGDRWINTELFNDRYHGFRVIDTQGQIVSDESFYDELDFSSNGIALYKQDKKCRCLIDTQGNQVYKEASDKVRDKELYHAVPESVYLDDEILVTTFWENHDSNVHIIFLESGEEYVVESATTEKIKVRFSEDLLLVRDNATKKCGYVNKYGQWVIEPRFSSADDFCEGLAPVKEDGLYGYIDHQGNYVIPPQFLYADSFSEGYAAVAYEDHKFGFIDTQGNIVVDTQYNNVGNFKDGLALVQKTIKGNYGYINNKGDLVIDCQFVSAHDFCYGIAAVQDSESMKFGYIDKSGKNVIPCEFDYADEFTADGLAQIYNEEDNVGSYIDRDGNLLMKPQFRCLSGFNNGYACVYLDKWQTIDYSDSEPSEWKNQYTKKVKMEDFLVSILEHKTDIAAVIGFIGLIGILINAIKYFGTVIHSKPEDN